jgi:aryl-alcohol dehydrogenase-like predicted oxidoreductase
MKQHTLGGAGGLDVSALCLGVMTFGTAVDEATSFAILDRFTEAGGTFIDTANNYGVWAGGRTGDESERLPGRWLDRRRARDRVVLATKAGAKAVPARGPSWPANAEGLADQGKAALAGASNYAVARLREARDLAAARGLPPYRVLQQRHSYLRPRPGADFGVQEYATDSLLSYVDQAPDLSLVAYSPLLGGSYARPDRPVPPEYDHPGTTTARAAVASAARDLGVTANQLVLAWMLASRPPVTPVIGVSSLTQLDQALAATTLTLDPTTLRTLNEAR